MNPTNATDCAWSELLDKQRLLWESGERPLIATLLANSPWEQDAEAQVDLIYNEIVIREDLQQVVPLEDYIARYPQHAVDLKLQFELHQALGNAALLGDQATLDTNRGIGEDSWPDRATPTERVLPSLPDYELSHEIGHGGCAVVYLARHRRLRRDVALKMFRPGYLPTARERLRFQAEAEASARLSHTNIVPIFEIGDVAGSPFLALELEAGGTLAQKLQLFPLSPRDAAELLEKLALAIQHAHDRQVLHRDLKPANILFAKDGTPKIADFGLAKLWDAGDENRDLSRTGEPLGTPRYMAPEQAAGNLTQIGPPTDVYALGTLLYECLTGGPPFVATGVADTLQKIRFDEPLSPLRLQPHLPRDLVTICLHCLQKEPSRRYLSAQELAHDLRRFLDGKPIHARPTPRWERLYKWCLRRPTEAGVIAVGLLSVAVVIGAVASSANREWQRINQLREEVASLITQGQQSLADEDHLKAQERFFEAWRITQSESDLADHLPGVSGWLDHSRRAADTQLWQTRILPREYDERRDDSLLTALLLAPRTPEIVPQAREAVNAVKEFIPSDSPTWEHEREFLTLLEADLVAVDQGDLAALELLLQAGKFHSRLYHSRLSDLYRRVNRDSAAEQSLTAASKCPPDKVPAAVLAAIRAIQEEDFNSALVLCEEIARQQPAHFAGRTMQGVCFLRLDRPGEARVALTACIAQRPTFPWSYYLRSQAFRALGQTTAAAADLAQAAALKPSPALNSLLLLASPPAAASQHSDAETGGESAL